MVKSTIIVRANDALPLAASVDDEEVRHITSRLMSNWLELMSRLTD
jgi:hypothetical protein